MIDQVRNFESPERAHNNCSGKHAGMLALSKAIGAGQAGYATSTTPFSSPFSARWK